MDRIYRARVWKVVNGKEIATRSLYFTDKAEADIYKTRQSKLEKQRYGDEFVRIEITQFIQWIE